jgi:hypothetical protein
MEFGVVPEFGFTESQPAPLLVAVVAENVTFAPPAAETFTC